MTGAIPHAIDSSGSDDQPQTTPRSRLMEAATRLFCKHGINATGIDAIVAEAGTAKTTLYKLFGSKGDLVEAVLQAEGRVWRDRFLAAVEKGQTPRSKLERIFPALKKWFAQDDYYGCAFINAVGEHDKDEQRLRAITLQHKSLVLSHIAGLAKEAGASKPDALAHQLGLLMDGAIVAAMVTRDPSVADAAAKAAHALIDAACDQAAERGRSNRRKMQPVAARERVHAT